MPIRFVISSRTDSGVHALCNAAHVDIERAPGKPPFPEDVLQAAFNRHLKPEPIRSVPRGQECLEEVSQGCETRRSGWDGGQCGAVVRAEMGKVIDPSLGEPGADPAGPFPRESGSCAEKRRKEPTLPVFRLRAPPDQVAAPIKDSV